MIEFSWGWVYLLLPVPLLAGLKTRKFTQKNSAINIPPGLRDALTETQDNSARGFGNHYRTIRLLLLSISWLALLTAIAQPHKAQHNLAQPASGRAMVVTIDLSTSMERQDFSINNESVDRLTAVKNVASQFIANRKGDRVGLVLFGSDAFIASPLSYDLSSVSSILMSSGIGMAGRTTAIGDALGLAIQSLRQDPATEKAIVLLSDGTNNAGSVEPEDAAALAKSLGIVVYTIGLGSDESSATQQFQSASADLDENTLKTIAASSGGAFFRARTSDELQSVYNEIDKLSSAEVRAPPLIIKQDFRNLFVIIALLCFVLIFFLRIWLTQQPTQGTQLPWQKIIKQRGVAP